jgi:hypothetical protein
MDDEQDRYWMHATGSKQNSTPKARLPKTTSRDRADPDRLDWIRGCAQRILSSYRRDDFADPDGFLVQLGTVLERYDDKVIEAVTSPVTGIQRTCKWPPSIAEFVEFAEEHIRRSTFSSTWDARSRAQLKERAEIEAQDKTESYEHRAEVVERVRREMAEKGFKRTKPADNKWVPLSAEALRGKYGNGDERPPVRLPDEPV